MKTIDDFIELEDNELEDVESLEENLGIDLNNDSNDDDLESDELSAGYFQFLKEQEILDTPEDFEFDGTPVKLKEALEITKSRLAEKAEKSIWESLPEDFKPLLEYAINGGTSIHDYLNTYADVDYEKLDLTNVDNQKLIVRQAFKMTSNHPDDRIENMIRKLESLDELEAAALDAIEDIKDEQTRRKQSLIQEQKAAQEQRLAKIKENNEALQSAIDKSANLEQLRKNKIKGFFFNQVKVDNHETSGYLRTLKDITSNPEHLVQFADILLDYDNKKGFDLSRLEKKAKTKATQSFRQLLQEKLDNKLPTKGQNKPVNEDFDWEQFNLNF